MQVSLVPCPFFHHFPDVLLCGICVFFFNRTVLDELFPMPLIMLSRMMRDLSPFTSQDARYSNSCEITGGPQWARCGRGLGGSDEKKGSLVA